LRPAQATDQRVERPRVGLAEGTKGGGTA